MKIMVNTIKNASVGSTSTASSYFIAAGSKPGAAYDVTINTETGHFCTCRGHLSKMGAAKRRGFKPEVTTAGHWCKHVKGVLANAALLNVGRVDRKAQRAA